MVLTNFSGRMTTKKKTTKGRKKIEIKKIEETNSRQVTFSKRRTGLFKKASELCVLTGAQVAILVNSPGGRVFAFGHPNADDVVDRYLSHQEQSQLSVMNLMTTTTDSNANNKDTMGPIAETGPSKKHPQPSLQMNEFNQHYAEVSRDLEMEKRRGEMIPEAISGAWFDEPIDGLDVEELEQYLYSLNELKKKLVTRADELVMIRNTSSFSSANMVDIGRNSNFQMDHNAGLGVPTNAVVYNGFNFQQFVDYSKF